MRYESLRSSVPRHGQALTLAGPIKCGKSLLQGLLTEIFGGRAAKPYRYMTGKSDFNADLFGCEHLMIEDECASTDMPSRKKFAAQIKAFTVNTTQSCHAKGRQALSLKPFWRLSISLNDSAEDLMVLPPIDEVSSDKIIILKARQADMPMPTETAAQQSAFWDTLVGELPAFLAFLESWNIPPDLRCERFGIKSFKHPELLEALGELASEARLLRLIDEVIFAPGWPGSWFLDSKKAERISSWVGTADRLERVLLDSEFKQAATKLLYWANATGTLLGILARDQPTRVRSCRKASSRQWELFAPSDDTVTNSF